MTADKERPCTSFAVTSAKPSEGKSLTAANIAISYAMLGKKVLLIDADMRKPTQRRLWRVEKPTGLCDFLAKISKLELDKVKDLPLWIRCLHEKQSSGSLMHQTLMNRRCRAEPTQAGWRRYISFPDGVHHSSIFCGTQCGDSANGKPRRFWSGCRHLPLMSYF